MILTMTLILNTLVLASPPISDSLTKEIPGANRTYRGIKNFKMVMPGVLYRGAGTGEKEPLESSSLQALCEDGFSSAVYSYRSGWNGDTSLRCNSGELAYTAKQWDREPSARTMLQELHSIIKNQRGAMYVHCWYGVHASGYLAAIALMQFCHYSPEQAVAYWNSNVPSSIQYPKVQEMIRRFQTYADLQISTEERNRVCPR